MAEWLYQIEDQSKHGGMLSTDRNQRLITDIKLLVLSSAFGSQSAAWAYDHTWYNLCPCRISEILMYFVLQLIFYSGVCWVVCLACTYVVLNNGQFFPLHVSETTPEILGPSHQSRTCVVLNRPGDRWKGAACWRSRFYHPMPYHLNPSREGRTDCRCKHRREKTGVASGTWRRARYSTGR